MEELRRILIAALYFATFLALLSTDSLLGFILRPIDKSLFNTNRDRRSPLSEWLSRSQGEPATRSGRPGTFQKIQRGFVGVFAVLLTLFALVRAVNGFSVIVAGRLPGSETALPIQQPRWVLAKNDDADDPFLSSHSTLWSYRTPFGFVLLSAQNSIVSWPTLESFCRSAGWDCVGSQDNGELVFKTFRKRSTKAHAILAFETQEALTQRFRCARSSVGPVACPRFQDSTLFRSLD